MKKNPKLPQFFRKKANKAAVPPFGHGRPLARRSLVFAWLKGYLSGMGHALAELHQQPPPELPSDLRDSSSDGARKPSWRVWLGVILLTLAWHLLLFFVRPNWQGVSHLKPAPVEVQQIDPKKLDAIRKQWRDREKQLLINKDPSAPKAEEAPPDARYMSDRNIRVEKEQRARDTNVVPKPPAAKAPSRPRARSEKKSGSQGKITGLGKLGVPLNLASQNPKEAEAETEPRPRSEEHRQAAGSEPGGDQALSEKNLPVGSENMLNAQESVYYSFYARIYNTIGPIWQSRIRASGRRDLQAGDYSTVVDVVCDAEGNLLEVRHLEGSGVPEFDQAVDHSWKKVGRFPNPPKDLLDKNGEVHMGWTFTVQVGEGSNLMYMPPARNY